MASRTEDARLRDLLAAQLGAEASDLLMERLPRVSHDELATKADIAVLRSDIERVDARVDRLRGEMHDEFGKLRMDFGALEGKFGALEGKFGALEGKFGVLEGKFGELQATIADKMRTQTWVIAGMVVSGIAAMGGIVAGAG